MFERGLPVMLAAPPPQPAVRRKFSNEEDEQLKKLVATYGAKNWDKIAELIPGRTGRQCRDRYRNYLIPGFFNGQWTQEEDDLLREKFQEIGPKWAKMALFFHGRSANALKNRWNYFVCRNPVTTAHAQKKLPEEPRAPGSCPLPPKFRVLPHLSTVMSKPV